MAVTENFEITVSPKVETKDLERTQTAISAIESAMASLKKTMDSVVGFFQGYQDHFQLSNEQVAKFSKSISSIQIDATDIDNYAAAVDDLAASIAASEKEFSKFEDAGTENYLKQLKEMKKIANDFDINFFAETFYGFSDENIAAAGEQNLKILKKLAPALKNTEVVTINWGKEIGYSIDGLQILGSTLNSLNNEEIETFGKLLKDNTNLGKEFRKNLEKQDDALWKNYSSEAVQDLSIEMKKLIKNVNLLQEESKNIEMNNFGEKLVENNKLVLASAQIVEEQTQAQEKSAFNLVNVIELFAKGAALAGLLQLAANFTLMEKAGNLLGSSLAKLTIQFKLFSRLGPPSGKSLFKVTEAVLILTPLIVALGQKFAESEIALVSLMGKMSVASGIVLTVFTRVVNAALTSVSDFSIGLGDKIINRMTIFSKSAEKAEETTAAFEFTILGFNRVVGESTGTLEFWTSQIDNLVETTAFGVDEIQKSVSLLVKEGAALGLNATQNTKLLKVAADVAAATGKDLNDVTLRIVSGLAGQTQGLLALGINVKQSAIDHSIFAKSLGKTATELTDTEAKLVRFNEIIKQSEPLLGAAANQLDTVRGANDAYERTLENIRIKLGETNQATRAYKTTLTQLAETFLDLPDSVWTVIGTFLDFSGVTLKVVGTLVKYLLTIGFIVTAMTAFNSVMGTSITLQTILGGLFGFVATKVGVQAVAITGLTSVFANLALIMKGTIIVGLKAVLFGVVGLTSGFIALTATILANPLFWAGSAIATTLYVLYQQFQRISKEMEWFTDKTKENSIVIKEYTTLWVTLKNAGRALLSFFEDIATLIVVGITAPILFAVKAWLHMKKAMADTKNEAFGIQQEIEKINNQIEKLGEISEKTQQNFIDVFGSGTAKAAENNRIEYEKIGEELDKNIDKIDKIRKITYKANKEFERTRSSNQFEAISIKVDQARLTYNKFVDDFVNGGKKSKTSVDDIKESYDSLLKAFEESQSLRITTFDDIEKQIQNIELALVKSSGQEIKAIRLAANTRDEEFDKRVSHIRTAFQLTKEEENKIARLRTMMAQQTENKINEIRQQAENERLKKVQDAAQKQQDFILGLQASTQQSEIQALKDQGKLVEAQQAQNVINLAAFDDKIAKYVEEQKLLNENFAIQQKTKKAIEAETKALEKRNAAAIQAAAKQEQDAAQKAAGGDSGPQLFGEQQVSLIESAFGDAAGQLAGSASAFMAPVTGMMAAAQVIVGAIQQLIDFLPNFINSVANVFTSLTDLPKQIFEALLNLGDALDYFFDDFLDNLGEFIPKIIEALTKISNKLLVQLGVQLPIKILGVISSVKFWRDVIMAFVDGLVDGLKEGFNAVANALGLADIFEINADEKIKAIGDQIKRASDQLFKVLELEQVSRGLDVADRIRNAILSASSTGANFFTKSWNKLKKWFNEKFGLEISKAWKSVFNWFTEDLPTAIWEAWQRIIRWFEEKFGAVISEQAKGFGRNISDQAKGFGDNVSVAAKGFGDNVSVAAKGFGDNISVAAKGFGDNISVAAKGFGDNISVAAKGFGDNISVAAKGFGRNISDQFQGLIDNITNFELPSFDIPDISEFKLPKFDIPSIPTPGWIATFTDSVNNLTNWSLPFSSGGLVGKVQNSVPSPGGAVGQIGSKIKSIFASTGGHIVGNSLQVPTGSTKNGILYAQTGAMSRSVGTDTIPAMLTPGEFVVNREATRNNLGLLSFINQNKDSVAPGGPQNSTFNITINAKTNLNADQIRREVVPELEKHLRRRSQQGKSVINAAGIRN